MKKIIAKIKNGFLNFLTPSTSALVDIVGQVEDLIDRSIDKQISRLSQLSVNRARLEAAIRKADEDINAAYKLLNRVSGLTK